MASDLISRSDLLTRMCQENCGERQCVDAMDRCVWYNYIKQRPTVDAVEVVHGEWISLTDCSNAGVYCSVCKKKVWKEDYAWCNKKINYAPITAQTAVQRWTEVTRNEHKTNNII